MLTVPHVIAGAAIGSLVGDGPIDNAVALTLGVASHYLLDKVPHWENWFGREVYGYPSGTPLGQLPKITIVSGVVDFIVAVGVLWLIISQPAVETPFWESTLFWGAFGGFLPDLLDNVPIVNNIFIKIPGVKSERRFHEKNHISEKARRAAPFFLGLLTQLIVVTLGLWLLF